ncbi:hypothetical protein F4819DRAFT_490275 [Hypoxylon fuscum]|nr:hypothetical protein F4819DRAFT_490275 [Hypoxylon fuscum]
MGENAQPNEGLSADYDQQTEGQSKVTGRSGVGRSQFSMVLWRRSPRLRFYQALIRHNGVADDIVHQSMIPYDLANYPVQ